MMTTWQPFAEKRLQRAPLCMFANTRSQSEGRGREAVSTPPEIALAKRRQLIREIEQLLDSGFTGRIVLSCAQGVVPRYTVEESRIPGQGVRQTPG